MIKTKSVYAAADADDGLRVLITRFYPRGIKREKCDVWERALAPSARLLKRYKNSEIGWEDFETALLQEFRGSVDSMEAIRTLRARGSTQNITLLCYERDGSPCHRYMVRDLIMDPSLLAEIFYRV